MPIPRFDQTFSACVVAVEAAADKLRYLRDSAGDIQARVILSEIPTATAQAKATTVAALAQMQLDPAIAAAKLADYPGAPQTVAAMQAAAASIETASAAFYGALGTWLDGLSVSDIVSVVSVDLGFGNVNQISYATVFPQALIDPLRQTTALNDFVTAFEAAGATA